MNASSQNKTRTFQTPQQNQSDYCQVKQTFVQENATWTQEQLEIFYKLFLEHGTAWSQISSLMKTKSPSNIKNKFNNSLRNASGSLAKFQLQSLKKALGSINKTLLLTVLQISNQTQKTIRQKGLTMRWQSKLFTYKSQIIRYCLKPNQFSDERKEQLIKLVNTINSKMRSCFIFKCKNLKVWKISEKVLNTILSFDKIIEEDIGKFSFNGETKISQPSQKPSKAAYELLQMDSSLHIQNKLSRAEQYSYVSIFGNKQWQSNFDIFNFY